MWLFGKTVNVATGRAVLRDDRVDDDDDDPRFMIHKPHRWRFLDGRDAFVFSISAEVLDSAYRYTWFAVLPVDDASRAVTMTNVPPNPLPEPAGRLLVIMPDRDSRWIIDTDWFPHVIFNMPAYGGLTTYCLQCLARRRFLTHVMAPHLRSRKDACACQLLDEPHCLQCQARDALLPEHLRWVNACACPTNPWVSTEVPKDTHCYYMGNGRYVWSSAPLRAREVDARWQPEQQKDSPTSITFPRYSDDPPLMQPLPPTSASTAIHRDQRREWREQKRAAWQRQKRK